MRPGGALALSGLALLCAAGCGGADPAGRPAVFSYIQPAILEPSCATSGCHSETARTAGLVLEGDPDAILESLLRKGLVYPGSPAGSPLLHFLRGEYVVLRMPPDAPLPSGDVALIERWIEEGAPP
jgi:hypothetical protein